MREGKIAIVEGTSCVGKTTLCESLKKQGWVVLPEAIRYLEKEKNQKPNEVENQGANSEEKEKFMQDEFFRIERQKIIEANLLKKQGKNVVIDKSFLATVATASAFEKIKGFKGTFKRAYLKYCELLQELENKNMVECDAFFLLTADYETIKKRNQTRKHILNGIWIEEKLIKAQRSILEKMTTDIIGSVGSRVLKKEIIDTTDMSKSSVEKEFKNVINNIEKEREQ